MTLFIIIIIFILIWIFNCSSCWARRYCNLYMINPSKYIDYFNSVTKATFNSQRSDGSIMVSIASYRDEQCSDTINNIITNADRPENLRIVVCQQNEEDDEDCLERVKYNTDKIEVIRMPASKAKGPLWARMVIQRRYEGSEYFLQIDSHTRLIKSWDSKLKRELGNDIKTILTQYPLEFKNVPKKLRGDPVVEGWSKPPKNRGPLYVKNFDKDGITHIQSDYIDEQPKESQQGVGWAAGFVFYKGQFNNDVKIDPCSFQFFGEQMEMATRAYTNGYKLKSPKETIAYHIYDRSYRTQWFNKPLELLSKFRLYYKLGLLKKEDIPKKYRFILNDVEMYGMGNKKSLKQYEKEAKINLETSRLAMLQY